MRYGKRTLPIYSDPFFGIRGINNHGNEIVKTRFVRSM